MCRVLTWLIMVTFPATGLSSENAEETKWGALRGQFVYQGEPPKQKTIRPVRRVEAFADKPLLDNSLLVHKKNHGVANVAIWLDRHRDDPKPAIHLSYADSSRPAVEISSGVRSFRPRVVLMRTSQTLQLVNEDTVGHNFKIDAVRNQPFNALVPPKRRHISW